MNSPEYFVNNSTSADNLDKFFPYDISPLLDIFKYSSSRLQTLEIPLYGRDYNVKEGK